MSSPDPKEQEKDLSPAVEVPAQAFDDLGVGPLPEQEVEVDLDSEEGTLTPVEQELKDGERGKPEGGGKEEAPPAVELPEAVADLSERLEVVEQRTAADQRLRIEARFKELDDLDARADDADNAELGKIQKDMEKAYESGDTKALAKLNIDSQKIVAKQATREEKRAQRKATHEKFIKDGTVPDGGGEPGARRAPQVPAQAQAWVSRNKWFNDRRYLAESAAARAIDEGMAAEGFDKNTPEYYAELDTRLAKRFPTLVKKPPAAGGARGPAPAVHAGGGGGGGGNASGGKMRLGPAEFAKMRKFNLDPRNPAHCRQYALEVRSRLRREAAEGEGS